MNTKIATFFFLMCIFLFFFMGKILIFKKKNKIKIILKFNYKNTDNSKTRNLHQTMQPIKQLWFLCSLLALCLTADYYKTLELNQDASETDIKKAFRRLSVK